MTRPIQQRSDGPRILGQAYEAARCFGFRGLMTGLAVFFLFGLSAARAEPDGQQHRDPVTDFTTTVTLEDMDSEETVGLDQAVELALQNNPGLFEIQARFGALSHVPAQVGSLPDPSISLGLMNLPTDTFNFSQEPMTQVQIQLSQAIPYPGKLDLRSRASTFDAAAAGMDVREVRIHLVRDVKIGWWTLFYLDRAIETVQRNQGLLRQFIEIAQTKYKVGLGLQQDVLLSQVELSRLLELEIVLTGRRRNHEARLNALMGRPTRIPLNLPSIADVSVPSLPTEDRLVEEAELNRPLLQAQRERVSAAQTRWNLAKRDFYPDFKVSTGYGVRAGEDRPGSGDRADFVSFGVSVSIPLFAGTKQSGAVSQRSAELRKEQWALNDLLLRVQTEISLATADFERARADSMMLKTGIIPQARQTVDSMRAGYVVDKVDFLNLVRAQISLYDYEIQYWKAATEAKQAEASVEAATGRDIDNG